MQIIENEYMYIYQANNLRAAIDPTKRVLLIIKNRQSYAIGYIGGNCS